MPRIFPILLMFVLCLAPIGGDKVQAQQSASGESSNPGVTDCGQAEEYIRASESEETNFKAELETEFGNTGPIGSEVRPPGLVVELIPYLNPDELLQLSDLINQYVDAVELLDPPEGMNSFHQQQMNLLRLLSGLARESSQSGLASAAAIFDGPIAAATLLLIDSWVVISINCPSIEPLNSDEGKTPSEPVSTPGAVAGNAELKNVHDAIEAQGLVVEYGRRVVRVTGLTPVGQELVVDGVSIYVFIFNNPQDRIEQIQSKGEQDYQLISSSGDPVGVGLLQFAEGSNVLVISDGASDSLQANIDAGIASLP